ncbi:CGNR zinc finger domain-containing protein [Pseudonocardia acaciae]|uniref:CGNR zinc finger domain-containing protein n=1 Tax=Pseudonocardia acaciae TaxID=551276 RepID=UPI0004909E3E|nr:ABATE domain-containing protein [Pseudonocardia acaciae]
MRSVFLSGDLALDFIGTVSEWTSSRVELLARPRDLADWLVRAGLLDSARADAAELESARELRDALYRHVRALTEGRRTDAEAVAVINRAAGAAPPALALTARGAVSRTGDVAAALGEVARAGITLAEPSRRALIGWCDDGTCTRAFLDLSRGRRRRWCGMAGCGDKAKAAAYRRRHPTR